MNDHDERVPPNLGGTVGTNAGAVGCAVLSLDGGAMNFPGKTISNTNIVNLRNLLWALEPIVIWKSGQACTIRAAIRTFV
jgi:hypothetical protein